MNNRPHPPHSPPPHSPPPHSPPPHSPALHSPPLHSPTLSPTPYSPPPNFSDVYGGEVQWLMTRPKPKSAPKSQNPADDGDLNMTDALPKALPAGDNDVEWIMTRSKPNSAPKDKRNHAGDSDRDVGKAAALPKPAPQEAKEEPQDPTKGKEKETVDLQDTDVVLPIKREDEQSEAEKTLDKTEERRTEQITARRRARQNRRYHRRDKRRRLQLMGEAQYAKVRLDREQAGRVTSATWGGEQELRELYKRLALAKIEAQEIVRRSGEVLSKWRELMLLIRELDLPEEAEGEDAGPMDRQTGEPVGDIADSMTAPLNKAVESWRAYCYKLECFHDLIWEKMDRKAFDDEVEVPDTVRLPVAHMPRAWEALDDSESFVKNLEIALEPPGPLETNNESSVAVSKLRSDSRVSEVTMALKQLKLVFEKLSYR